MATGTDNAKQLKIQTGVVKRLAKEKTFYLKELETNAAKVEKAREAGKDESDIKLAEAVLEETKTIIPTTEKNLLEAFQTLEDLVEGSGDNKDSKEYRDAVEALDGTRDILTSQ